MNSVAENFQSFEVKGPDTIPLSHLEFLFSQADKRLEESHKSFESTTTKSVTIITLLVATLTAFVSYFFDKNDLKGTLDAKLIVVLFSICYVYIILIYMLQNILPCDYQNSGSAPKGALKKGAYGQGSEDFANEKHLKDRYFSELVNYDFRIKVNFSLNNKRLDRYRFAILWLTGLPVAGFALYFLLITLL